MHLVLPVFVFLAALLLLREALSDIIDGLGQLWREWRGDDSISMIGTLGNVSVYVLWSLMLSAIILYVGCYIGSGFGWW